MSESRIIQSLWIGDELPEIQRLGIRSFLAEGHEYQLFTYGDVDGIPPGTTVRDGADVLPSSSIFAYQHGFGKGSYSAFSNVFRYKLLLDRGGWWVDTDVVCLKPFSISQPYVFATERDSDGTIYCATSVLKCPRGAPILAHCLGAALACDKRTVAWAEIGPLLLTDAIERFGLASSCVPVDMFNPIDYFDCASVAEPGFDLSRIENSYSVHLWNQMRINQRLENPARVPRDSLYGFLVARYTCDESMNRAGSKG